MKRKLIALCALLSAGIVHAQDRPRIKFGNITPEDFKPTVYAVDSNAAAVVIADIGSTEIVGNNTGSFSLEFKNYRRAHILNKNGFSIGDVQIGLYTDGQAEEELENLKATTYNLENGKVVQTKLEIKSAVFKDKINKNLVIKKFTFPNIKEGSIIEFEYRIKSDFIRNLQPWEFQGEYPRLWSEYNVAMPNFYSYVTMSQGYHPMEVNDRKMTTRSFQMADIRGTGSTERLSFNAEVTDYRWAMKNVPALKKESYTSTVRNHISKIEFQLSSVGYPFQPRSVMASWEAVSKILLEDEEFGAQLKRDNGWLNDVMPAATKGASTNMDKARNIYAWVRDNFTCTNHNRLTMDDNLKNILKKKSGNEAEINLLLTVMLRKAGMKADPVMLSTKSHGYTHSVYPLLDRFNYVICLLREGKEVYYLDASEPRMGFGKLDWECYNGHARIINEEATPIEMNAEELKEESTTSVFIINNDEGKSIGSYQQTAGYFSSTSIRETVKEKGKEQVFKDLKKDMGEIEISMERLDSLDKYDERVGIAFDLVLKNDNEDILYINPMFGEGIKENPFKSAQRFYPVEMPFTIDETFNLQMEVPAGYVVDELPKQTIVKFNEEGDAIFEYRLSQSGTNISLRSRLVVKKTVFLPEEYEILREFFGLIVKKHNEQIVFKKKK